MKNDRTSSLLRDQVQLRLVGIALLERSGRPALRLERKDAALLALLAIDGATPRARAAALLWPDASAGVARGNLRQRLFRLRAAAGRDLVIADDSLLRLADDVRPDLATLQDLLRADPQAAQGELLAGQDYGAQEDLALWVQAARAQFRAQRIEALAQAASDCEAERQLARALLYAQRMVADEPLLEHAHRRLMRLHYLRGDRAGALAAYDACRQVLGDQLGMRPSAETVELARLVEASGALAPPAASAPTGVPRPPRPVGMLRPPRLVGRDGEWQTLRRRLGSGGAVLIEGEAGIGKSRLLTEVAHGHAGEQAVVCGARPGDARLAYALAGRLVQAAVERFDVPASDWARAALAHIAPLLGATKDSAPLLGAAQEPAPPALRLQQALIDALRGWRAQGLALLALDDLHFADEASIEMLPALLAALREAGVPVLLATRPMEGHGLATLSTPDDSTLERVALGPLDASGVQALLESLALPGLDSAAWAPALLRHTGGNPLFILETLIAQLDANEAALHGAPPALHTPASLGALVERRLAPLSPGALKLARLAAVAGADFSVALAAGVLGQHALDIADHWRELEAAHVIRDAGFAHDLIYEATLRSVPAAIARHLHEAVAQHLQAHGGPPSRIAPHWQAAERWAEAGSAYEAAALAAQARSRRAEEATLYERAADCHERDGDARAAFRVRCASVPSVLAARPAAAADALTERLLADAAGDQERLDALLQRALIQLVNHAGAPAHETAQQAYLLARRGGATAREFDAARYLALSLGQIERAADGLALLGNYRAQIESEGSPRQRCNYWSDSGYLLNRVGQRRNGAAAARHAALAAEALGDRDELVTCTSNLAIFFAYLGQPQQAYESALRAQRIQAELGHTDDIAAGVAAMNVASFGLLLGRFDEALTQYAAAEACLAQSAAATWSAGCAHNLASAWLQLGQTARAQQALTPLGATLPAGTRARRSIVEGRIARAQGRPALAALQQALLLLGDHGDPVQRALAEIDTSLELPADEAAALCRQVFARCEAVELHGAASKALLHEIDATRRGGVLQALPALLAQARERRASFQPIDCYWASALWIEYQALAAIGDDSAPAVLHEAARWVRETALPHVPEPFRDAFLHRHPVNRPLLTLADRLAA